MSHAMIKDIVLHALLKEKLIDLDFAEKNRAKIIEKLVDLIAKSGKIKNKKAFLRAIHERERLGSTGIGNGVAIPHAKSNAVRGLVMAFAKSKAGVDFGALDGERVHLFFMLASPQEYVGEHLKILAKISSLIKDKFIVEMLKRAQTKRDVLKVIASGEKMSRQ